jgi:hypothetical protein
MKMTRSWWAGVAAAASLAMGAEPGALIFEDTFDHGLAPGWRWIRETPGGWRVKDGALEIRLLPGDAQTVKNALVRPAPEHREKPFAIELTLRSLHAPTEQYEQAGITWYHDGKPVFKLVKELVDGRLMMIPGRQPMTNETVQLRLEVDGRRYVAKYRPEGRGPWLEADRGELPPPDQDEVSIQGYHGPEAAEHWVRFDDFRILRLE